MFKFIQKLGPGIIFAGAAIGVSHLVQSTRAGADFGYGLIWALLLINAIKYPFIRFAPLYTTVTGFNLIDGYEKLGKWVLGFYYLMTFVTMFSIQAAVTIVTAGLASYLFGVTDNVLVWSILITFLSATLLFVGRYKTLDQVMKLVVIVLTISTLIAVVAALGQSDKHMSLMQTLPHGTLEIAFFIAFLGWMPTPLDVSVWQSLWTQEKQLQIGKAFDTKQSLFDFNIGYVGTIFTGLLFITLGALAYYGTAVELSPNAGAFANQLIEVYKKNLGGFVGVAIGIAAFTTMFSTTLTTLDASPRVMTKTTEKFTGKVYKYQYLFWISVLAIGTIIILAFFTKNMKSMVMLATIISFLTAPFYAILNLILVTRKDFPEAHRPSLWMRIWSILGIGMLIAFSLWYLWSLM
jgi:Mn2+/Fe2+ NRAMP family transporter